MILKIGNAKSLSAPIDWTVTLDDRSEKIETIGGVYIQDNGIIDEGTTINGSARFSPADFLLLKQHWAERTPVTVIDQSGATGQWRVKLRSYKYVEKFEKYVDVSFELWR